MKRVTAVMLLGIFAAAYSAEKLNSTLLNQLSGKMPEIKLARNILNSVAFILDEYNEKIGLAVALEDGILISHKKFVLNIMSYGFVFVHFKQLKFSADLIGVYQSVALMKINLKISEDIEMNYSNFEWAKLMVTRRYEDKNAISVSFDDTKDGCKYLKKFLLKKKVEIISHWQIGEHLNHRTKKLENNDFEKEGDLLFFGSAIIGVLVKMPDSEGISEYQNVMQIHKELAELLSSPQTVSE